jgi:hypothetical protein
MQSTKADHMTYYIPAPTNRPINWAWLDERSVTYAYARPKIKVALYANVCVVIKQPDVRCEWLVDYTGLLYRTEEAALRRLLERWVSEVEPAIVRNRRGNIIGLCDAAAPLGSSPFVFKG